MDIIKTPKYEANNNYGVFSGDFVGHATMAITSGKLQYGRGILRFQSRDFLLEISFPDGGQAK